MTKWFGKSWGAPCCEEDEHCETPVGMPCQRCGTVFTAEDQGVATQLVEPIDGGSIEEGIVRFTLIAYHVQCYVDTLICPGCPRCQPERFN